MATYNEENSRDNRVIVAGAILAIQIIGVILLLLGGDRIMALAGAQPEPTAAAVVEATAEPEVDTPATAAVEEPEPTAEVVAEIRLPSAGEAGVLTPEQVDVGEGGDLPTWLAQIVEGVQPDESTGSAGVPPHLLLSFAPSAEAEASPVDDQPIDLNQPQMRVVPISALLAWLEARGDAEAQSALEQLRSLLQEQPAGDEASVPVPPILGNAEQAFVARVNYEGFNGGTGVGYLTNITGENILPVTNESGLNYIFQGVTADGEQYVFMSWPVAAAFLPETAADVTEEIRSALDADPAGYYADLDQTAETAANPDFRPNLSTLATMLGGLAIGADQVATMRAAQATEPSEMVGTVWQWQGFSDPAGAAITVEDPENYELVFWPDGTFSLKADCNVGGGTYEMDEASLSLELGPLTRAMCPPDSLSEDFIRKLGVVDAYNFDDDGNLVLNLMADGGEMTFASGGPADVQEIAAGENQPGAVDAGLTGFSLEWPGFTNAAGETIAVENPEDYQLILLPDGTFNVKADCNVGRGTYTYDADGTLQLLMGPMTLAACGPDSQSDAFLAFLNSVNGAAIAPDGTVTLTTSDGSSAVMVSGGPVVVPTAEMAAEDELIGTVWQWTRFEDTAEVNDIEVGDPESYLLVLLPGGGYTIKADCNVGRGSYVREGSSLSLTPGPLTRALCPPESLGDEFVRRLAQTATYVITEDGELALNLALDSGNMVFANGGPVELAAEAVEPEDQPQAESDELTGLALQWPGFTDAAGNSVTVENPEDYGLVLFPDGTFTVKADCNVGSGTYTYDEDGSLVLTLGPLTRALCPPESQSDAFLNFLNGVNSATTDENGNVVMTTGDGSTASFEKSSPVETPQLASEATLTGIVWQWTGIDAPADGNDLAIEDPASYSIVFNEDGSYGLVVDCNVGGGSFEVDGAQLTILPGITTLAACEPPTFDRQFLDSLAQVESYAIDEGGNLVLTLADGAGVMNFANGGPPAPQGDPLNTVWRWNSVTDPTGTITTVPNPESYYLVLLDDGTYVFRADCNSGAGGYTIENGSLTIMPGAVSLVQCAEGSLSDQFLGYFGQITGYSFDAGGNMILTLADGSTLSMTNSGPFTGLDTGVGGEGIAPNPLSGTAWQWSNFRDAKQDYSVPAATPYTVTFNDDGTVNVVADCNTGSGTYAVDGSRLSISPLATTLMACPEGSLGGSFIEYLTFAETFTLQGDVMFIDLMADGGRMTFTAIP